EGKVVHAGTILGKTPREATGITDITGGLPRVTEIFEARKPKDPAVMAEIDGLVEILQEKRRGKRTIIVKSESGIEREHLVMDRFDFKQINTNLSKCLKITHKGDSEYAEGTIVPKETLETTNAQIEALGGAPAKGVKPKAATASTQLLGITKAAVQSSSFIS